MTRNFASARTIREGSVGLLLLVGVGVLGGFFLWLNRLTTGNNSYKAIVEFANAGGMQKGGPVRFRGVQIGNISAIRPNPNGVDVEIEISQRDLIIPANVIVEANQSGLISENIIDITPSSPITFSPGDVKAKPLDKNCDRQKIVCSGSRLKGGTGTSFDELIRKSTKLADTYSDEKFYSNLNKVLDSTAVAAANIAQLSANLNTLTKTAQNEIKTFSSTASSIERAANNVSSSATQTINKFGDTADTFGDTADKLNSTVNQFSTTAKDISSTTKQVSSLLTNLDSLVTTNRSSLVSTLNNIKQTSEQLRTTVTALSPAVNRLTQGEILKNLETLTANASEASANLKNASVALNDPKNILVLQQTLDSARVTFENTQKITSDLDELTGDPKFRDNLRQLVNGLSNLVSSSQDINQQVQLANTLDSIKTSMENTKQVTNTLEANNITFAAGKTNRLTPDKELQQRQEAIQRLEATLKKNQQ
jgi:phospholipid/cholesterol/gamma-HCH transport system substrate-binding protein